MGGRRRLHEVLHRFGHALERRGAAGQHLQRQQGNHHQQSQLRHRTRYRAQKDAQRRGGVKVQRHPQDEEGDRAPDRHSERTLDNEDERRRRHDHHHQAHGPHLGHHDFERGQRHHQQMLDGAVLTLADHRCAGENDGQGGDAVDQLHHRTEPHRVQIRIEEHVHFGFDRQDRVCAMVLDEGRDLAVGDDMDITVAEEGLRHTRGVNVDLDRRLAPGQHVALEIGRDVENKGVEAYIHAGVGGGGVNDGRHQETGWIKGVDDVLRQLRAVFVNDGDGRHMQRFGEARGDHIDLAAEREADDDQHHGVAAEAAQLLDPEMENVEQCMHNNLPGAQKLLGVRSHRPAWMIGLYIR